MPSTPKKNAVSTGAKSDRIAERPEARVTTISEVRASPRNSMIVANTVNSGSIRYMVAGAFSKASSPASTRPTTSLSKRRICRVNQIDDAEKHPEHQQKGADKPLGKIPVQPHIDAPPGSGMSALVSRPRKRRICEAKSKSAVRTAPANGAR